MSQATRKPVPVFARMPAQANRKPNSRGGECKCCLKKAEFAATGAQGIKLIHTRYKICFFRCDL